MARHLTMGERTIIAEMHNRGESGKAIAQRLGRHPSTISRELRRNFAGGAYSGFAAQILTDWRRRERPVVRKMDRPHIQEAVCEGLARFWSPDQIAGRLRREYPRDRCHRVSHQTIYNWIKRSAERKKWERFLRRKGRHRKPNDCRGKLKRTVSIAGRPPIVDRRERFGDWEGDTIIGGGRRGALVTHVERKSGYLMASAVKDRKSHRVNQATRRLFRNLPSPLRRTLTLDNGKEFAGHETMARQTGLAIYFADPGAAWQRGTNENTNGLLRQFFPKGSDLYHIHHGQVHRAVELLNNRPRKRLGYRTPREILKKHFQIAFEN